MAKTFNESILNTMKQEMLSEHEWMEQAQQALLAIIKDECGWAVASQLEKIFDYGVSSEGIEGAECNPNAVQWMYDVAREMRQDNEAADDLCTAIEDWEADGYGKLSESVLAEMTSDEMQLEADLIKAYNRGWESVFPREMYQTKEEVEAYKIGYADGYEEYEYNSDWRIEDPKHPIKEIYAYQDGYRMGRRAAEADRADMGTTTDESIIVEDELFRVGYILGKQDALEGKHPPIETGSSEEKPDADDTYITGYKSGFRSGLIQIKASGIQRPTEQGEINA
jgi:hypothetical protein